MVNIVVTVDDDVSQNGSQSFIIFHIFVFVFISFSFCIYMISKEMSE